MATTRRRWSLRSEEFGNEDDDEWSAIPPLILKSLLPNYPRWKRVMEHLLRTSPDGEDAWRMIKQGLSDKEDKREVMLDARVRYIILSGVEPSVGPMIWDSESAKEMWEKLRSLHRAYYHPTF